MRFSLSSPGRRAALVGGYVLLPLILVGLTAQNLWAWWAARGNTRVGLERAVRIQPRNPDYPLLLGVDYLHDDPAKAAELLQHSTALSPHSSRGWLALADAYGRLERIPDQQQAIFTALKNSPKDVEVEWLAGNLYLTLGEFDKSFPLFRDVLSIKGDRIEAISPVLFAVCEGDAVKMLPAIPGNADARLRVMQWLVAKNHADQADRLWPAVFDAEEQFAAKDAIFYIESLIARRETQKAYSVWLDLAKKDSVFADRIERGSIVSNGDFENDLEFRGFDWIVNHQDGINAAVDSSVFHRGNASLSIAFDTNAVSGNEVYENVPLEPSSNYVLKGFIHAEELQTANGIRAAIENPDTHENLVTTDPFVGTFPWREFDVSFTTGPAVKLGRLEFTRVPTTGIIKGRVWFDDLRIEKK